MLIISWCCVSHDKMYVSVMLILVLCVTLLCCCGAIPSEYHHMAFVGFRRHEPSTSTPLPAVTDPSEVASRGEYELEDREGEVSLPVAPAPRAMEESSRQSPYSYYYIGRKLWYVPLYFSLYFIFYVGALIIRAIARHKVTYPSRLPDARSLVSERSIQSREQELDQASFNLNSILDEMMLKYM